MGEAEQGMGPDKVTGPLEAERWKAERNRLWREENLAALDAYGGEVAREGLALASFRMF